MKWRKFADEKPVAISVLAAVFSDGLGDWVFGVLDPPFSGSSRLYTHWTPLDRLRPDVLASSERSTEVAR